MRGSSASVRGISDLPMQLLIGACLMAVSLPVFHSAYDDLSEELTIDGLDRSVNVLFSSMERVLQGDNGSVIRMELELSDFGSCRIRQILIGGSQDGGTERYLITYSLSTGYSARFSLDPPYPISSPEDGSLEIEPGRHSIYLRNVGSVGKGYIEIWCE